MYVPAGWVHQMENLQMCIKLAWEVFGSSCRFPVCLAAWQSVHSKIDNISAPDLVGFSTTAYHTVLYSVKPLQLEANAG